MTSPEGLIKIYGMATANIFCELLLALFAGIKKARPSCPSNNRCSPGWTTIVLLAMAKIGRKSGTAKKMVEKIEQNEQI